MNAPIRRIQFAAAPALLLAAAAALQAQTGTANPAPNGGWEKYAGNPVLGGQ